jgi:hypothetical protein
MAASDLKLTFSDIYTKVSEFLGTGSSPTGAKLTKAKNLTYRGYRRFLFPKFVRTGRAHTWSFLRQDGTLSTEAGKYEYPLPEHFEWFWYPPQFSKNSNYPQIKPVTMQQLLQLRSSHTSNSYPQFWSLGTMPFDVSVGTRYKLVIHPPANQVELIHFGYVIEPDKPTADAEYFIGSAADSECILECALAEAESQEDDNIGHHDARAKDLLHTCIERDLKRVPQTVGSLDALNAFWTNPELARDLRFVDAADTVYGIP